MQKPQDQSIVTEYFSKDPFDYAEHYSRETAEGYSFRVRRERLLESLGKGNGKVLDVGCGPAVMTKEIRDLGWTYVGSDVSAAMIDEARKRAQGISGAEFQVGTVEKITSPDNTFDAVVAMGLVEYVTDDEVAAKEMRRVLKPGGKVFVSLPNCYSPARIWDKYLLTPVSKILKRMLGKRSKAIFHREYSTREYSALLKKVGFDDIKVVAYNFRVIPRPFDGWFPWLAVTTAKIFEPLRKTPLWFIATGVNVEATKR